MYVAPAAAEIQLGASARRPLEEIKRSLTNLHLATDGDRNEQQYWPIINEQFPNYESFWQHLVAPMTKSICFPEVLAVVNVDLYAVGQLLGHRTPRMTQRYAHLSHQYMAGAVGSLIRCSPERSWRMARVKLVSSP